MSLRWKSLDKVSGIKNTTLFVVACLLSLGALSFLQMHFVRWVMKEGLVVTKTMHTALPWYHMFFLIALFHPIIEEIIYRLPLRFTVANIIISLVAAAGFFAFRSEITYLVVGEEGSLIARFILFISFGSFIGLFFLVNRSVKSRLEYFWSQHYGKVVVGYSFLFAIGHLLKYNITLSNAYGLVGIIVFKHFFFGHFFFLCAVEAGIDGFRSFSYL